MVQRIQKSAGEQDESYRRLTASIRGEIISTVVLPTFVQGGSSRDLIGRDCLLAAEKNKERTGSAC